MKILVLIIFIGIASVVFYLFLRRLFEDRSYNVTDLQGEDKITPLLPKEETLEDKKQPKGYEPEDIISEEEKQPTVTEEALEVTESHLKETTVLNPDLEEDQD
jgi:hypothetical protein